MNAWLVYAVALAAFVAMNLAAARIAGRLGGRRARRPRSGGGPARPSVDELLERMTWEWRREDTWH